MISYTFYILLIRILLSLFSLYFPIPSICPFLVLLVFKKKEYREIKGKQKEQPSVTSRNKYTTEEVTRATALADEFDALYHFYFSIPLFPCVLCLYICLLLLFSCVLYLSLFFIFLFPCVLCFLILFLVVLSVSVFFICTLYI